MGLVDAFKKGGLPAVGVQLGANLRVGTAFNSLSEESRDAIFKQLAQPAAKPFLNVGFTDKLLVTLALTFIGIAAVRKAIN